MSGFAGLKSLQPYLYKQEPSLFYCILVGLARWLCYYNEDKYTAETAAAAIDVPKTKVTSQLRKLPMSSRKGNGPSYWSKQDLLQFFQIHGVVHKYLDEEAEKNIEAAVESAWTAAA